MLLTTLRDICLLVTGFDAFADVSLNPSQVLVENFPKQVALPEQNISIQIRKLILPTAGESAWAQLKAGLEELPTNSFSAALLLGHGRRRLTVNLERFALNIKDYGISDNLGQTFEGKKIDESGPEALRTTVSVEKLAARLMEKGLPVQVSNFCGTFICNEVYYQTQRYQQLNRRPQFVLFAHLPLPSDYGATLQATVSSPFQELALGETNQMLAMQKVVMEAAQWLGQQLIETSEAPLFP